MHGAPPVQTLVKAFIGVTSGGCALQQQSSISAASTGPMVASAAPLLPVAARALLDSSSPSSSPANSAAAAAADQVSPSAWLAAAPVRRQRVLQALTYPACRIFCNASHQNNRSRGSGGALVITDFDLDAVVLAAGGGPDGLEYALHLISELDADGRRLADVDQLQLAVAERWQTRQAVAMLQQAATAASEQQQAAAAMTHTNAASSTGAQVAPVAVDATAARALRHIVAAAGCGPCPAAAQLTSLVSRLLQDGMGGVDPALPLTDVLRALVRQPLSSFVQGGHPPSESFLTQALHTLANSMRRRVLARHLQSSPATAAALLCPEAIPAFFSQEQLHDILAAAHHSLFWTFRHFNRITAAANNGVGNQGQSSDFAALLKRIEAMHEAATGVPPLAPAAPGSSMLQMGALTTPLPQPSTPLASFPSAVAASAVLVPSQPTNASAAPSSTLAAAAAEASESASLLARLEALRVSLPSHAPIAAPIPKVAAAPLPQSLSSSNSQQATHAQPPLPSPVAFQSMATASHPASSPLPKANVASSRVMPCSPISPLPPFSSPSSSPKAVHTPRNNAAATLPAVAVATAVAAGAGGIGASASSVSSVPVSPPPRTHPSRLVSPPAQASLPTTALPLLTAPNGWSSAVVSPVRLSPSITAAVAPSTGSPSSPSPHSRAHIDRTLLLSAMTFPRCKLFTQARSPVELSDAQLDALLAQCGHVDRAISLLRSLEREGVRVNDVAELTREVESQLSSEARDELAAALCFPRCTLFTTSTRPIEIEEEDLDALMDVCGGLAGALHAVEEFQALGCKFLSFAELTHEAERSESVQKRKRGEFASPSGPTLFASTLLPGTGTPFASGSAPDVAAVPLTSHLLSAEEEQAALFPMLHRALQGVDVSATPSLHAGMRLERSSLANAPGAGSGMQGGSSSSSSPHLSAGSSLHSSSSSGWFGLGSESPTYTPLGSNRNSGRSSAGTALTGSGSMATTAVAATTAGDASFSMALHDTGAGAHPYRPSSLVHR